MPALMQKEPVFLIKVGPKKGLGSIKGRTLIINGGNLRGHVKADICIGPFVSALRIARAEQEIVAR
jgi:hypothetical protein